jgi:ATP-dependent helicase YprA (DUF1998 family)
MGGALREARRAVEGLVQRQAQRRGSAPQAHHAHRAGKAGQVAYAGGTPGSILTSPQRAGVAGASWSCGAVLPEVHQRMLGYGRAESHLDLHAMLVIQASSRPPDS